MAIGSARTERASRSLAHSTAHLRMGMSARVTLLAALARLLSSIPTLARLIHPHPGPSRMQRARRAFLPCIRTALVPATGLLQVVRARVTPTTASPTAACTAPRRASRHFAAAMARATRRSAHRWWSTAVSACLATLEAIVALSARVELTRLAAGMARAQKTRPRYVGALRWIDRLATCNYQ